jgi:hypothetical protein
MKSTMFAAFWAAIGVFIMSGLSASGPHIHGAADVFGGYVGGIPGEICCNIKCTGCLSDHNCKKFGSKCIERIQQGINQACLYDTGPGCSHDPSCATEDLGEDYPCQEIVTAELDPYVGCHIAACEEGSGVDCGELSTCEGGT